MTEGKRKEDRGSAAGAAPFAPGQKVIVGSAAGDFRYPGIVRPFGRDWRKDDPMRKEWRVVRFDDGATLSVHVSNLAVAS